MKHLIHQVFRGYWRSVEKISIPLKSMLKERKVKKEGIWKADVKEGANEKDSLYRKKKAEYMSGEI